MFVASFCKSDVIASFYNLAALWVQSLPLEPEKKISWKSRSEENAI